MKDREVIKIISGWLDYMLIVSLLLWALLVFATSRIYGKVVRIVELLEEICVKLDKHS